MPVFPPFRWLARPATSLRDLARDLNALGKRVEDVLGRSAFHDMGGAVFDVKAFGAVGDGLRDDTDAIEAAIAAGNVVFFPVGIYIVSRTIELPEDRVIELRGAGQGVVEGATPSYDGAVIRRATGFTDAMFTQSGTSGFAKGVHVSNLSFAADRQAGDGFRFDWVNFVQFDCVTFHRLAGKAVRGYGLNNSWFRHCRWYGCGDASNEVVVLDGSTVGSVQSGHVDFIGCTWEQNHGTDLLLTRDNASSTAGTTVIQVIGGKFESRQTDPPGLPMVIVRATQHSSIRSVFGNGKDHDATHIVVGGSSNSLVWKLLLDSQHTVFDSTDADNPRYLVDVQDGGVGSKVSDVIIRGNYHHGAGDSGAQIRIAPLLTNRVVRVFVDPANTYSAPLSGIPISGFHCGPQSISADRGDATVTLVYGLDAVTQRFDTALTANRTVHIDKVAESSTAYPPRGARFRIVRKGLGAFTLNLLNDFGGTTIKTLPASTAAWAEVEFDGTDWVLVGYGTL